MVTPTAPLIGTKPGTLSAPTLLKQAGGTKSETHPFRSGFSEHRSGQGSGAVGEQVLFDADSAQDAEVEVGHAGFALAPVGAVPEAHGGAAGDERGEVGGVVGGAGTAAEEDDGVVEQGALAVFAGL